jgi:hypothetical protein
MRPACTRACLLPIAGTVCLGLAGCVVEPLHEQTRAMSVVHAAGNAIDVRTANGGVTVVRGPGPDVSIAALLTSPSQERLALARVEAERNQDGALLVFVTWPGGRRQSREGCSLDITVPEATGVRIETSNGSIRVGGLGGPADLTTSNGSVHAVRHDGPVVVRTSNGRIELRDVEGRVDAATSNGTVDAKGIGAGVRARSSNGPIQISLRPDASGPVDADSSNGAVELVVGPAFAGEVNLHTSNGSVSIPSASVATVLSQSGTSADVRLGTGGEPSRLRTSNAGVRLRVIEGD